MRLLKKKPMDKQITWNILKRMQNATKKQMKYKIK